MIFLLSGCNAILYAKEHMGKPGISIIAIGVCRILETDFFEKISQISIGCGGKGRNRWIAKPGAIIFRTLI